jgi:hypothetical protein
MVFDWREVADRTIITRTLIVVRQVKQKGLKEQDVHRANHGDSNTSSDRASWQDEEVRTGIKGIDWKPQEISNFIVMK